MKKNMIKAKSGVIAAAVFLILIAVGVTVRLYFLHEINSVESLQEHMKSFGVFAPISLIMFQAAQVIVPVIPGAVGYAAGTLMFGTFCGFLYNYIGITLGSVIAFFLARKFGIDIVLLMFSEKKYKKWSEKINKSKSYDVMLAAAILLPVVPDDFFCYFSGLVKYDKKKFLWIIILLKPWCILLYSIMFAYIK